MAALMENQANRGKVMQRTSAVVRFIVDAENITV